jgi:uncharacterized protein (TIGR02284 family)
MNEKVISEVLCDIIALDHDAVDAYDQAIKRIQKDDVARQELARFKADHERHIRDLAPLVRRLGDEPPTKGDFRRFLTQGRVVLGSLAGDAAILRAMKSNEDATNQKYEASLRTEGLLPETRTILERGLNDERRHRAWLESRLAFMRAVA